MMQIETPGLSIAFKENLAAWDLFDNWMADDEEPEISMEEKPTDGQLLIIIAAALSIENEKMFTRASQMLSEPLPIDYEQAQTERLPLVHHIIEMALCGAILINYTGAIERLL